MTEHQRLGPPPIEPLSDAAWARVERGVWSQLDAEAAGRTPAPTLSPSPRRWWLVAAPVLAAAAVAVIVVATRSRPVEIETSRVVTDAASSSVSYGDSHIELDARTALVMSHEAAHPLVLLERGTARFTVAPRLQRPAFIVRAGDATVRVVGTQFRVARSEERIAVSVERGLVNVEFRGSVVPVGAGQRWSSDAPTRIAAMAASPTAVPPASGEPEIEMEGADDTTSGTAPPHGKPAGHKPRRAAGSADARADVRIEPKAGAEPTEVSDDPDRIEYDRLATLEPRSPDAALRGYMALGRGTSRWAAPALYAAARLAVDRHDPRAETFLAIYLQRFPDGANAADARKLLTRLKNQ
ncbi:MAG: FecR domain-containing protein [Deltaproteobacteria bacterium]|nr:MAG: FecR domain-containing protein [Deltaproteobacteria bacterium]